jgi:hypothetical protein
MGRRSLTKYASVPQLPSSQGLNLEASDNWISADFVAVHAQTQTNAQPVSLAAVALQAKYSGIFEASISAMWSDGTTAKTVRLKTIVVPFAAPVTRFTGGDDAQTFAGRDVLQDLALGAGNWSQEATADTTGTTANGVLFNGVAPISTAPNATVRFNRPVASLTGLLTADAQGINEYSYTGVVCASSTVKTPFTRGNIVVLSLELTSTNGGDVVGFPGVTLYFRELPLG